MTTYEITAEAEGKTVLTVQAESEEEAERIAYDKHLIGISIEGGMATWAVTDIREVA